MSFYSEMLAYLHRIYRSDLYINAFLTAFNTPYTKLQTVITRLYYLLHFNLLDEESCKWWENLLNITDATKNITDRRSKIQAKWRSNQKISITQIQEICDLWQNGEIEADFIDGKIQLEFIASYGIPEDLESLKKSIEEIKPAHLSLEWVYKFFLKKEIHNVMTKSEMQTYKKNKYCNVGVKE